MVIHDQGFRTGFTREYLNQYELDLSIIEVMKDVIEQNLSEEEFAMMLDEDTMLAVLEKGYIKGKNKHGESKKYPLITICSERVI